VPQMSLVMQRDIKMGGTRLGDRERPDETLAENQERIVETNHPERGDRR
jgi:hypothetical protein